MAEPVMHDSNTDIFRGQLFLFLNEQPIAFGTTATLSISADEVDVTNKMVSGSWKDTEPGQKSYTISSESMFSMKEGQVSFDSLYDIFIDKGTVEFAMGEAVITEATSTGGKFALDKSKPYKTGVLMIASLELTSEASSPIATFSSSFTGKGALLKGEIVAAPEPPVGG